jgi:hypothetical protein
MDDGIKISFARKAEPSRVIYRVERGKDCNTAKLTCAAQALVYIAATESRDGFEKEIETITKNVMSTRMKKISG